MLEKIFQEKKKTTNKKSHEDACNKFLVISRKWHSYGEVIL